MNRNVKRATLVLAMTPLMSIPAVAAYAGGTTPLSQAATTVTTAVAPHASSGGSTTGSVSSTSTDAPSSTASASAAKINGIIAVSDTSASAGSSKTSAHSDSLYLLGSRVVGGDATGDGKAAGGNLVGTGDTPLGDVEVLPWSAVAVQGDTASKAQAEAALAHAGLLGVLQVWLLHSQSQATWTPGESAGTASTDGFEANLDDQLDVKVLHADASSDGKSSSALVVVNGQPIGGSSDANGQCQINLDPVAAILCLQAAGGKGSAAASVADVTSKATGLGGVVSGASSAGGHAATPVTSTAGGARSPKSSDNGPLPNTDAPAAPSTGRLPFTGSESGLLALYGAVLTGLGAAITAVARRRRPGMATA